MLAAPTCSAAVPARGTSTRRVDLAATWRQGRAEDSASSRADTRASRRVLLTVPGLLALVPALEAGAAAAPSPSAPAQPKAAVAKAPVKKAPLPPPLPPPPSAARAPILVSNAPNPLFLLGLPLTALGLFAAQMFNDGDAPPLMAAMNAVDTIALKAATEKATQAWREAAEKEEAKLAAFRAARLEEAAWRKRWTMAMMDKEALRRQIERSSNARAARASAEAIAQGVAPARGEAGSVKRKGGGLFGWLFRRRDATDEAADVAGKEVKARTAKQ